MGCLYYVWVDGKRAALVNTLLAGATAASLGFGCAGCGSAGAVWTRTGRSVARSHAARTAPDRSNLHTGSQQLLAEWDHDGDSGPADEDVPNSSYDGDDREISYYGHAASAATDHAVTTLVEGYYRAVAVGDDASACSSIAADVVSAFAEQARELPGRSYPAGGGCPTVIWRQFAHASGHDARDLAAVAVIGVRIQGDEGLALLRMRGGEVRDIPVGRKDGKWKLEASLDNGLP